MRSLYVVVLLVILARNTAATSPVLLACAKDQLYLNTNMRTGTLYAALMASSHVECRKEAMRIACVTHALTALGMPENDVLCTLDCSDAITTRCPDAMLLGAACARMSPSECARAFNAMGSSIV